MFSIATSAGVGSLVIVVFGPEDPPPHDQHRSLKGMLPPYVARYVRGYVLGVFANEDAGAERTRDSHFTRARA